MIKVGYFNRITNKVTCLLLSILVGIWTIFNTCYITLAADVHPFQKFIVKATCMEEDRDRLTDDYLNNTEKIPPKGEWTEEGIEAVAKEIAQEFPALGMGGDELKEALTFYADIDLMNRGPIIGLIQEGTSYSNIDSRNYSSIAKTFNKAIVGSEEDNDGLKLLFTLMDYGITAKNADEATKIDFEFVGNIVYRGLVNAGISKLESFANELKEYPGSDNVERLLSYAEETVNKAPDEEIYHFKKVLKEEINVFDGEPTNPADYDDDENTGGGNTGGGSRSGGGGGITVTVTPTPSPTLTPTPTPLPSQAADSISFNDIDHVPWAHESINTLAERGIIAGMGNGQFKPDDNVTRAQFVKMLVLAFELVDNEAMADFTDVQPSEWYYPYIASAQKHGIVNGFEDGSFGVDAAITRQDMAVMAFRAAQKYEKISDKLNIEMQELNFADKDQISEYARQSVGIMQKLNIINGVGENRFAPQEYTTRAAAAKVIYGLLTIGE